MLWRGSLRQLSRRLGAGTRSFNTSALCDSFACLCLVTVSSTIVNSSVTSFLAQIRLSDFSTLSRQFYCIRQYGLSGSIYRISTSNTVEENRNSIAVGNCEHLADHLHTPSMHIANIIGNKDYTVPRNLTSAISPSISLHGAFGQSGEHPGREEYIQPE